MVKIRPGSKMEDAKEELRGIVRKMRRVPPGVDDDFAINQQDMVIKQFDKMGKIIAAVGLFHHGPGALRRWNRDHEHHVRLGGRAHERDRYPQSDWREATKRS